MCIIPHVIKYRNWNYYSFRCYKRETSTLPLITLFYTVSYMVSLRWNYISDLKPVNLPFSLLVSSKY